MAHRTLGCLPGTAVAHICVHLFGSNVPAMVIIFGVWLRYSVQTGREGGLDRLFSILIGSAMLYDLD